MQHTARSRFAHAIFRVAAVALLLLAAADLSLPEVCGEDSHPLVAANAQTVMMLAASDSEAPAPLRAEDCFCCCSHIVGEDARSPLGRLALVSDSDRIAAPAVPPVPVRVLFHPPRLA